jgi:hypothetical protein
MLHQNIKNKNKNKRNFRKDYQNKTLQGKEKEENNILKKMGRGNFT